MKMSQLTSTKNIKPVENTERQKHESIKESYDKYDIKNNIEVMDLNRKSVNEEVMDFNKMTVKEVFELSCRV